MIKIIKLIAISPEAIRNRPSVIRGKSKTEKISKRFSEPRESMILAETKGLFSYA